VHAFDVTFDVIGMWRSSALPSRHRGGKNRRADSQKFHASSPGLHNFRIPPCVAPLERVNLYHAGLLNFRLGYSISGKNTRLEMTAVVCFLSFTVISNRRAVD
jgi:hypothetical protein